MLHADDANIVSQSPGSLETTKEGYYERRHVVWPDRVRLQDEDHVLTPTGYAVEFSFHDHAAGQVYNRKNKFVYLGGSIPDTPTRHLCGDHATSADVAGTLGTHASCTNTVPGGG